MKSSDLLLITLSLAAASGLFFFSQFALPKPELPLKGNIGRTLVSF